MNQSGRPGKGCRLVPVASGKGGVGKSIVTACLGLALADLGLRVILIDLDLGGSNLHSMLGMDNSSRGLGGYAHRGAARLEDTLQETPYANLRLIGGDSLLPGTANIPWWFKKKLLTELLTLPADMVLMDLGAGSSYNTIDFFLSSREGIVVATPEPTALVNAYSFLKNAYYRLIFRLFPSRTPERKLIRDWAYANVEKGEGAAIGMLDALELAFPGAGNRARSLVEAMSLRIVLNDYYGEEEGAWANLVSASRKNLGLQLTHLGSLPHESAVRRSSFNRVPPYSANRDSAFSQAVVRIASNLAEGF